MSTAMKERPILFSAPMVRAILEERKTQTRRVVKPQPLHDGFDVCRYHKVRVDRDGTLYPSCEMYFGISDADGEWATQCPYGQPGDRLWVRESWAVVPSVSDDGPRHKTKGDGTGVTWRADWQGNPSRFNWKPSIHMPRWASRITLEITDVRVERLQDISEEDAQAEGMNEAENPDFDEEDPCDDDPYTFRAGFIDYLKNHGHMDWDANPWVWVIEFSWIN